MAEYPPFVNGYGTVPKILEKIKEAKTPERFTLDYLGSTLGFPGGTARPFIPLAKRIGLLGSDGKPTELYGKFRDPNHSKGAMAEAIRKGYADLFTRNEKAHQLDRAGLEGLVVQATGLDTGSATLRAIIGTFENLKKFASFDGPTRVPRAPSREEPAAGDGASKDPPPPEAQGLGLSLSYSINLVLPKTDDIAVFNAIFRSLRENLLGK